MKLVSTEQMQNLEKEANQNGLIIQKMMDNAGSGLATEIVLIAHSYNMLSAKVVGLVGSGNNGSDSLIAMSLLVEQGFLATAYLINRNKKEDPFIIQFVKSGGKIVNLEDDGKFAYLHELIVSCDLLVDGILGTGFKPPIKTETSMLLQNVNKILNERELRPVIIAVDCPSGVDNDSGEVSIGILSADYTICMAAVKQGLLKLPAHEFTGKIRVVDIGFNKRNSSITEIKNQVADGQVIRSTLPIRQLDAHKGTFGTAIIVAGSINYSGAALLAGKAAYRVGAGLVTLGVPAPLHGILAGQFPEATWLLLPHEMGVISASAAPVIMENIDQATALLIGCGLGLEATTYEFMELLLSSKFSSGRTSGKIGFLQKVEKISIRQNYKIPPLVVDADGLKLLTRIDHWTKKLPPNSILTPHPGEMEILTGIRKDEIQADRLNIATRYAKEWEQIVVLKGAFTVIASPDGRTTTIPVATPALARAGSGDVLAGMIVGFLAQGMDAYSSAISGAWFHAQAGLLAAERLGGSTSVIAGDLIDEIPYAIALTS